MSWNDLLGQHLEHYQILSELGRGGSSRVYKARDTKLNRDVAIKVIPNDAEDRTTFIKRFDREVEVVRQLSHPNIVEVYDSGQNDDIVYLIMQCVTGGTLRKRAQGPLPVTEAVDFVIQMAQALRHAHRKGIVHRDVKPSNMLLEAEGSTHVLLTDFGIAKIQGARGVTKSGMTVGTPEYMSPEQAEGKDVDQRADIYALGCVLYELLAGRPPFHGSTPVSVLFQHVNSRPAYIRGFNPQVPHELWRVLMMALAKRPDERYPTAESLAGALAPFASEGMSLEDIAKKPTQPPVLESLGGVNTGARVGAETSTDRRGEPPEQDTAPMEPVARPRTRLNGNPASPRIRLPTRPLPESEHLRDLAFDSVPLGDSRLSASPTEYLGGGDSRPLWPHEEEWAHETGWVADSGRQSVPPARPRPRSAPVPSMPVQKRSGGWSVPTRVGAMVSGLLVLVVVSWVALSASGLGIARPEPTPTATIAPTATATVAPTPTITAAPTNTATPSAQDRLNQRAAASFRAVTLATFQDSSCSSGNSASHFSRGSTLWVNLCASSSAVSAPMTITLRQSGRTLATMRPSGQYIVPTGTYSGAMTLNYPPGTYDILVTLTINGSVAVARDSSFTIS